MTAAQRLDRAADLREAQRMRFEIDFLGDIEHTMSQQLNSIQGHIRCLTLSVVALKKRWEAK
jgi:hypothetical protein